MKTLLIDVSYSDNTGKYWFDSDIKKQKVSFDPEKESVHNIIKRLCEENDGMELTYKGKPMGNVFRDRKDGTPKIIGYMYRGKCEIQDRSMIKPVMGYWDVWVTIDEIKEFEFEEIDL